MDGYDFIEEIRGVYAPSTVRNFYSLSEYIDEFTRPCGGFRIPWSWRDRAELWLARQTAQLRPYAQAALVSDHALPLNWQALLAYAYTKGLLATPSFHLARLSHDVPHIPEAALARVLTSAETDGSEVTVRGGCSGHDLEDVFAKTFGEFLERYYLATYQRKDLIRDTCSNLKRSGMNLLPLEELNTFSADQKKRYPDYVRDEKSEFSWVEGRNAMTDKKALIPAQLVYWNYQRAAHEPVLSHPTTSGAAGHYTRKQSILGAAYELVQRDAFLLFWLNTLSPPVIDVTSFQDVELERVMNLISRYGLEAVFVDVTSDLAIPACVCVIRDRRGTSRLALGASCGFNPRDNLVSSALEALRVHGAHIQDTETFSLPEDYIPFSGTPFVGREERLRFWKGEAALERAAFFTAGERASFSDSRFARSGRAFSSVEEEWRFVLDLLHAKGKGYELYAFEVKSPVLHALGYHVTKVVIPRLMSLYLNERFVTLEAPRLTEVPIALGYAGSRRNAWPHPFP